MDRLSIEGHELESGECDVAGGSSSATPGGTPVEPRHNDAVDGEAEPDAEAI